jgi:hypothetical protein
VKINIFVPTQSGGRFANSDLVHSSITGERVSGPAAPEDDLITEIDESRMRPEKVIAIRFLTFLGNRRLTMESLKKLSIEEQKRIKKEFIEG